MMESAWLEASLSDLLPDDGAGPISMNAIPYDIDLNLLDTFELPAADVNSLIRETRSPADMASPMMAPLSPPDSAQGWSGASHDGGSSSDSEDPALLPDVFGLPPPAPAPVTEHQPVVVQFSPSILPQCPPPVVPNETSRGRPPTSSRGLSAPVSPVHTTVAPDSAAPRAVNEGGAGKAPSNEKQKRKTAHNAIERRYRNSINDKIAELRLRLPDYLIAEASKSKSQMNKSRVIQKGIEYIAALESSNAELLAENERLRQLVPGADANNAEGEAAGMKRKKIKVEGDSGRVLLCVLACGLVGVTMTGNGPSSGREGVLPGATGHGAGRVLAGTADADDVWRATVDGLIATAMYWMWRLFVFAVCAALFLKQDVVTDPAEALQNETKSKVAAAEGNAMKQKYYASTALALVGAELPVSTTALVYELVVNTIQQLLHRLYIGVWVDRFFSSRSKEALASAQVRSTMNQAMLHACISRNMEAPADSAMMRLVLALRALNAAEAVGTNLDRHCLIKAYVTVATQVRLVLQNDVASVVNDYYIRQARRLYWQNPEAFPALAWLFRPNGDAFFRGASWCTKVPTDSSWKRLYPGTFAHLQATYHLSLLEQGLVEIVFGTNTDKVQDVFEDLRQSAGQCGDTRSLWWGTLGLAHVCWRKGQKQAARRYICELDSLMLRKSKIEHFAYATSRAHLALLDGDQKLCWQALEVASGMCTDWTSISIGDDGSSSLPFERFARLLGHQQLLNTRVALVRLRSYLKQKDVPLPLFQKEGSVDAEEVTRGTMLSAVQRDIGELRRFSQNCAAASSSLLKYQAIHRSLAGGRVALTEHMFHQSLKSAKQLGLPYEEASTLLHSAVHLHSSMPKQTVRDTLNRAVTIFEQMQAAEELQTSRKLLQLVL